MNPAIALLFGVGAARAAEPASYPLAATVELHEAELLRLDLPPEWLERCPDPGSYLLLDPTGVEVPFASRTSDDGAGWRSERLIWKPTRTQRDWAWEVQPPASGEPVHALRLSRLPVGGAVEILVQPVEAAQASRRGVLWNLPDSGAGAQLDLPLGDIGAEGPWRIEVEASSGAGWIRDGTQDLGFEAVIAHPWSVLPTPLAVEASGPVPSSETSSDWLLRLPRAGLPLRAVEVDAEDPLFSRPTALLMAAEVGEAIPLGRGTLERVAHGQASIERNGFGLHNTATADLLLRVEDGRSPPLDISGVELSLRGLALVVPSPQAGPHRLLGCGPDAPAYDLERLEERLAEGRPVQVTAPSPASNGDWQPASAGAGLLGAGPVLDTEGFLFEREIRGPAGLVRVVLDDHAMAKGRRGYPDLRFLDSEDRQLPYLLQREPVGRVLDDILIGREERDGISALVLTLPQANLPAKALVLSTGRTTFEREVRLISAVPGDAQGLSATIWRGSSEGESRLVLPVPDRLPRRLELRIDNGDNPPLPVDSVSLIVPTWEARVQLPTATAIRMLYGHTELQAPRYDLALLREHVLTQPVEPAALGPVLELAPPPREPPKRGLLLGVIAIMAALLLALTVRLLKTPEEG